MKREQKIWGQRWLIRCDSTHAVSYLELEKNVQCSWHRHETKYNLFVVLEGELILEIEELDNIKTVTLNKGEEFTIKPGQWHLFRCFCENTKVIEEMFVEYNESDIERQNKGNRL
jgi:mannose-6-phosphate isomerase-like protein (cupin superfamily)